MFDPSDPATGPQLTAATRQREKQRDLAALIELENDAATNSDRIYATDFSDHPAVASQRGERGGSKKTNLTAEFNVAQGRVTWNHMRRLAEKRVFERLAFADPPVFGVARIITSGGFFEFSDDRNGTPAVILPVGPDSLLDNSDGGVIDDLLAFEIDRPDAWYLRRGDTCLLGEDEVDLARIRREPLWLWSTPLNYLIAGASGAVIIDWRIDPRLPFDELCEVRCFEPALAARVRSRIAELAQPRFRLIVHRSVGQAAE
jgi:hypothetical protein